MSSHLAGSTSGSSAATLRPRNRRLISIEGDDYSRARSLSPVAANPEDRASIVSSRDVSPLPAAHPSRATSSPRTAPRTAAGKGYQAPSVSNTRHSSTLFTPGYWETSWSSIQGIASTLLGSDVQGLNQTATVPRRKAAPKNSARFSVRAAVDEWGPSGSAERQIAQGSQEERLAKLQAKKREVLLQANGHAEPDRMGQYKRRTSIEEPAISPRDHLMEMPVYLHHVQKSDTLAGLSIRYNCAQSTIRRANRLYPNDTIQIRRKAYLPVDECSVRGKKVASPASNKSLIDNLLDHDSSVLGESNKSPTISSSSDWTIQSPPPPNDTTATSSVSKASPFPTMSIATNTAGQSLSEPPYLHDSWVVIDHIAEPVEIVRMSRRALGYFPPARRRSQSYTDATPLDSPVSDLPSFTASLASSPNRSWSEHNSHHTSSNRHGRSVSSPQQFEPNVSQKKSSSRFLSTFSGPGGVGSLSRTTSPGPAMDKLNSFWNNQLTPAAARAAAQAASHLPFRLPNNLVLLSAANAGRGASPSPRTATGLGGGLGSLSAARTSLDSVASAGSELAGRMEGWVRRTGGAAGTRSPAPGSDLIELQEGTDGEQAANGQRRTSVSGMEIEEERLLRERFPMRGRVFEEQSRGRGRAR